VRGRTRKADRMHSLESEVYNKMLLRVWVRQHNLFAAGPGSCTGLRCCSSASQHCYA
jgi:hypothetical protein